MLLIPGLYKRGAKSFFSVQISVSANIRTLVGSRMHMDFEKAVGDSRLCRSHSHL